MSIFSIYQSFFGSRPGRTIRATRSNWRHSTRCARFEQLESRQMLSITPGDFPITGDDTLTADMVAIDRADGPEIPPFPPGLED